MTGTAESHARVTRWVSARGISLEVRGTGDPVLLLHGIGGSATACGPLAEVLSARGYRTYCWDAPGYGRSADPAPSADGPAERYDHAAAVAELITELGSEPIHLIGTSWGGVIATAVAIANPASVRSLVLADSTRGSGVNTDRARGMRARIGELRELGGPAFAAARARRLVSPACDDEIARAVESEMARVRLCGYTAAAEFMARTDTGPSLAGVAAPTLVLVGADDIVTGVDESRLLADAIPGARFGLILGAGHAAIQEKPAETAAHILRLWKELDR
ncbi:alpha/beta fold hydrolase [Nocardia sp. FBN12]|uniref:alpha/beta fold hydrolase n=1 Tax=Nocardia sp. FBN12 TaxID=3419766 RepID=UPI003D04F982